MFQNINKQMKYHYDIKDHQYRKNSEAGKNPEKLLKYRIFLGNPEDLVTLLSTRGCLMPSTHRQLFLFLYCKKKIVTHEKTKTKAERHCLLKTVIRIKNSRQLSLQSTRSFFSFILTSTWRKKCSCRYFLL
jgi:hypothetical protein